MLLAVAALTALALSIQDTSIPQRPSERVGNFYEISRNYQTTSTRGDGGSSSSRGRDDFVERVISVRDDGVEVEFDLATAASADDRQRQWQLPARVFKPTNGPLVLLNAPELEERLTRWLELGQLPREACGRWIFTWNAFKIECDPQSILATLEEFDLTNDGPSIVEAPLDSETIRRERAESDVVVAEITGSEILSFEQAMINRAAEAVTGKVTTTLEVDTQNRVIRRTELTVMEITEGDGTREQTTSTRVVDRRLVQNSAD